MICLCGATVQPTHLDEWSAYRPDGRRITFLGVPAEVCPACGEIYFTPESSELRLFLMDASEADRIPCPNMLPISPDEIRQIRKRLTANQERFGALMGVSKNSVAAWEAGRRSPDGPSRVLLRILNVIGSRPQFARPPGGELSEKAWQIYDQAVELDRDERAELMVHLSATLTEDDEPTQRTEELASHSDAGR